MYSRLYDNAHKYDRNIPVLAVCRVDKHTSFGLQPLTKSIYCLLLLFKVPREAADKLIFEQEAKEKAAKEAKIAEERAEKEKAKKGKVFAHLSGGGGSSTTAAAKPPAPPSSEAEKSAASGGVQERCAVGGLQGGASHSCGYCRSSQSGS